MLYILTNNSTVLHLPPRRAGYIQRLCAGVFHVLFLVYAIEVITFESISRCSVCSVKSQWGITESYDKRPINSPMSLSQIGHNCESSIDSTKVF